MKSLFFAISLLFLVSCSSGDDEITQSEQVEPLREVDLNQMIFHKCRWYEKDSTTPFTGKVTWTGGKPEEPEWVSNHYGSFEVKDGLSDGLEVWFRGDGSPFQTQNYKKGKFHGESIWYKQYSSDQWVEDGTVGDVDIRGFYIEGDPVGGTVELLHSDGTVEIKKHDEIFSDSQPCDPSES